MGLACVVGGIARSGGLWMGKSLLTSSRLSMVVMAWVPVVPCPLWRSWSGG